MKTISTKHSPKVMIMVILAFFLVGTPVLTSAQTEHHVAVTNNVFTPDEITISAGDKVIWTCTEGNHNVNGKQSTFPSNPESFGNSVGAGWTYEYTFNTPGTYDYQCDPHVAFGMFGKVIVEGPQSNLLTVNFTGMTPHVGQELSLLVKDKDSGEELERQYVTVSESFSVMVDGIMTGHSYEVDFYSDHNGNGHYDAPPADHAWRMDLDNVDGDSQLDFAHNTNFTDIEWDHKVFVKFSGMTPHVGQELYIALYDETSGMETDRESVTVAEVFTVDLGLLISGNSYRIDFFSDHNDNGMYDAPPADHAWTISLPEANGDEIVEFSHNTNFTDINWMYKLNLRFRNMTPHVGQMLTVYLKDLDSKSNVDTIEVAEIPGADFELASYAIMPGGTYRLDFFADHNGNGMYDAPPADHAWRIEVGTVSGDTEVEFEHNTNFTDIFSTTGINNLQTGGLKIYPNPVEDHLFYENKSGDMGYSMVKVYSTTGSVVFNRYLDGEKSGSLNLSKLDPGYYIIEFSGNSSFSRMSVLKR